jgi:L-histidine N-alpha-methyltransferase
MHARRLDVHADSRFHLVTAGAPRDRRATMIREIRAGLARTPRSIPPKYFYDDEGSRLFDAICELPEYYLTRAERGLLVDHAQAIVGGTAARTLVEMGSGMARKTGPLLQAIGDRAPWPHYVPFDIAPEAIRHSARELLRAYPRLRVRGVVGDFIHDVDGLGAAIRPIEGARLFAFLGSTIGNLDETEAPELLRGIARLMSPGDRFLLGVDRVKAPAVLHAAYNDAQGVTAAFNKNVLRAITRELQGDIDVDAFEHLAFYDAGRERIEMHLVSARDQTITLRGADLRVDVARGERIMTEISRKFTRESCEQMLTDGGMTLTEWFTPADQSFALCVARVP